MFMKTLGLPYCKQFLLSLMNSSAYNRIEGLNFVVGLVINGTDDCAELSTLDIHLTAFTHGCKQSAVT